MSNETMAENYPDTTQEQPEPTSNGDPPVDDVSSQINLIWEKVEQSYEPAKGQLDANGRLELVKARGKLKGVVDYELVNGKVARVEEFALAYWQILGDAGIDPDEFTETETAKDTGNSAQAEVRQEPEAEAADKPAPRPPSELQTKMVDLIARQKDIEPKAGTVLLGELDEVKVPAVEAVEKGADNAKELVSTYAKEVTRAETIVADLAHNPDESVDTDSSEPAGPSEMFEKLREHFHGIHRRNPFGRWRTAEELKELAEQKPDPIIVTIEGRNVIVHQRNTIVCGKPGSGKTWIALLAAINAARSGGRVVIFNHEEGHAQGTARLQERLQLLCPQIEKWWDSIRVVEPGQWTSEQLEEIREISIEWLNDAEVKANSLVVLDSISRAGGAVNDANEFNEWWNINIEPWAGFGVICVAHESKIDPRGPLGSVAAMAFFDTVLRVKCAHGQSMWNSETEGCVTVYVLKDRHSDSGKSSGDKVAVIIGTPTDGQLTFTVKDAEHLPDDDDPPPSRDLRADIIELIESSDGTYTKGFEAMRDKLECNASSLRTELKGLVDEEVLDKVRDGRSYHYVLIGD